MSCGWVTAEPVNISLFPSLVISSALSPPALWGLFINTNSYFTAQLFSVLMALRAPCKHQGNIPLGELGLRGAAVAFFQSLAETALELKLGPR